MHTESCVGDLVCRTGVQSLAVTSKSQISGLSKVEEWRNRCTESCTDLSPHREMEDLESVQLQQHPDLRSQAAARWTKGGIDTESWIRILRYVMSHRCTITQWTSRSQISGCSEIAL
ncbi:hypothetical protein BDQ12DRAFT_499135 [Crucibulum laeve]|uniref:Uncharacterized protein n=1 Tax=Crucibulum laeve TaxID=68775 RepID=A0A5C3LID9_9AGAR|nr:hypothetical protein BDQ12DRAFT_499135 [Crucibulum laeve]